MNNKRHSLKEWFVATRPWSFPASTMPVLASLVYLYWRGHDVNWLCGLWAILNIALLHASGNTWSDYFDYKHGVDAHDTYGSRTIVDGLFAPRQILRLALVLLAVGILSGVAMLLCTGLPLLAIGLGGVACTLLYPPFKFHALGDTLIFVAFALLPSLGTSYVATGAIDYSVLNVALPVGLIVVAILHANNTRDVGTDRRAGIVTPAMKLGATLSSHAYCFEVLFPFVWIALLSLAGVFPLYTLLVLPALPAAIGNSRTVLRLKSEGSAVVANLDEKTAKLLMLFGLLFALSFFVSGLLA